MRNTDQPPATADEEMAHARAWEPLSDADLLEMRRYATLDRDTALAGMKDNYADYIATLIMDLHRALTEIWRLRAVERPARTVISVPGPRSGKSLATVQVVADALDAGERVAIAWPAAPVPLAGSTDAGDQPSHRAGTACIACGQPVNDGHISLTTAGMSWKQKVLFSAFALRLFADARASQLCNHCLESAFHDFIVNSELTDRPT